MTFTKKQLTELARILGDDGAVFTGNPETGDWEQVPVDPYIVLVENGVTEEHICETHYEAITKARYLQTAVMAGVIKASAIMVKKGEQIAWEWKNAAPK